MNSKTKAMPTSRNKDSSRPLISTLKLFSARFLLVRRLFCTAIGLYLT